MSTAHTRSTGAAMSMDVEMRCIRDAQISSGALGEGRTASLSEGPPTSAPLHRWVTRHGSLRDLGFHQLCEQGKRLLPTQVARLDGNDSGYSFLQHVQLRSTRHFLQGHRRPHLSRQVRVVKRIRVANAFERYQFQILSSERVAVARGEVRERHLVRAADPGFYLVDFAGKAVGGKPLDHCVGVEERPIDSLRCGTEHAVETYGTCPHDRFAFRYLGRCRSGPGTSMLATANPL